MSTRSTDIKKVLTGDEYGGECFGIEKQPPPTRLLVTLKYGG